MVACHLDPAIHSNLANSTGESPPYFYELHGIHRHFYPHSACVNILPLIPIATILGFALANELVAGRHKVSRMGIRHVMFTVEYTRLHQILGGLNICHEGAEIASRWFRQGQRGAEEIEVRKGGTFGGRRRAHGVSGGSGRILRQPILVRHRPIVVFTIC